jgi:hypothetical protein
LVAIELAGSSDVLSATCRLGGLFPDISDGGGAASTPGIGRGVRPGWSMTGWTSFRICAINGCGDWWARRGTLLPRRTGGINAFDDFKRLRHDEAGEEYMPMRVGGREGPYYKDFITPGG